MSDKFLNICKARPFDEKKFLTGFLGQSCAENVDFDSKVINSPSKVLGIRIPTLRKIGKALEPNLLEVLKCDFWHEYYELQTLKGLLITKIKDADLCLEYLQEYAPTIDNWASCDLTAGDLKIVSKNLDKFEPFIHDCIKDEREFVCRFGIILLMKYYLDDYLPETLQKINSINSKHYYVNMALGWLICESFLKDKENTLKYLKNAKISTFAVNKGIQKIRESLRVEIADKQEVLKYKR